MKKIIFIFIGLILLTGCIRKHTPKNLKPIQSIRSLHNFDGCYQNRNDEGWHGLSYIFSGNTTIPKSIHKRTKYICLKNRDESFEVKRYDSKNKLISENLSSDFTLDSNKLIFEQRTSKLKNGAIGRNFKDFYLTLDTDHNILNTDSNYGVGVVLVIPIIGGRMSTDRYPYIGPTLPQKGDQ